MCSMFFKNQIFDKDMFLVTTVVYVLVFKYSFCERWQERRPLLKIQQGFIEGITVDTDSSRVVNCFLKIPYAMAPIGMYRFMPPQKHQGWNGTYQADKYGAKCAQLSSSNEMIGQEDCLYLNIWTPVSTNNFALLPVVIFLEGFNFYRSSKLIVSGEDFAAEGAVVVTVNYRLNIFGFFCLKNDEARGNLGLLDQYLAILWVKSNIKQFGGDPNKITLFGHSSGAVSVALHIVSPRTSGLFQRAIIASGSAVSPWQLKNDPGVASNQMLHLLGCTSYHSKDYLKCVKSKTTEHVLRALREYSKSNEFQDMFLPTVDNFLLGNNQYLPLELEKAFKENTFVQVPILTGIAKPVSSPELYDWLNFGNQGYQQLQYFLERTKIPEILSLYRLNFTLNFDQLLDLINWKVSHSTEDVKTLFNQIRALEFESKVEAPHYLQLSYLGSYVQPIFAYFMEDVELNLNVTDELATTDVILLFGPSILKDTNKRRFSLNEERLSNYVKRLWLDFINLGDPTPQRNRLRQWRKYTLMDPYVEEFDKQMMLSKNLDRSRIQRVAFWNNLLPKMAEYTPVSNNVVPKELQKNREPGTSYKHAMFTLIGLVIALLIVLVICILLLKKKSRERDRELHLGY